MRPRTRASLQVLRALRRPPFGVTWLPRRRLAFNLPRPPFRLAVWAWVAPRLRVAHELDLAPDLLILDPGLATVGLVHIIDPSEKESSTDQAKRHVDKATYLRHLLITRDVGAGTERFPLGYTVECVLLVPREELHGMIGAVREIAANTQFLHASGLNLIGFPESGAPDESELRRGFAWLLPATRERLSRVPAPAAQLKRLELLNYRLPDQRTWELGSGRVHLLHGANGTGKSSIAEALELAVTGSVERIAVDPRANYADIIRHRHATDAAVVKLTYRDGQERAFTVVAAGTAEAPLDRGLPVTAFRLDQNVMDQLIRSGPQNRARILTRSFFPGPGYTEFEAAQASFDRAYRELPSELVAEIARANPDPNRQASLVVPRLGWVEAPSIPPERLADCLPIERSHLEALGRIVPEITESLKSLETQVDRPALEAGLKKLDEALGRIRDEVRRYHDAVVHSLDLLPRLDGWMPVSGEVQLEYTNLLRQWTEQLALSELMKKHLELSRSLQDARTAGWQPSEYDAIALFGQPLAEIVASGDRLAGAAEQCNRYERASFKQLQGASSSRGAPGAQGQAPAALTTSEITALNLVGTWLGRQETTPPEDLLGRTISDALSENDTKIFGTMTIGGAGWTRRAVDFLAPLAPALNALLDFEPKPAAPGEAAAETPIYRSPLTRLKAYETAVTTGRALIAALEKVEATLMKRLAEEADALDEVIALFTPARWAYEGLLLKGTAEAGTVAVSLTTRESGSAADMRLNTAELNIVVLALYLLCAPRIANPLGTVVLDDPLQNMDELTSATVARGLTKIASLLGGRCQLVIMFHNLGDLETFRRELPADVYYLPWLGPAGHTRLQNDVRRDQSRPAAGTHLLDEVARREPAREPAGRVARRAPSVRKPRPVRQA